MSLNNTTLNSIYKIISILSGRHVSTFIMSSSGPLRKQIQELSKFQCIVGSQMFIDYIQEFEIHKFVYIVICVTILALKD